MNEIISDFVDCKQSLDEAMKEVGGAELSLNELQYGLTALDLIAMLSTNRIRFTVKPTLADDANRSTT